MQHHPHPTSHDVPPLVLSIARWLERHDDAALAQAQAGIEQLRTLDGDLARILELELVARRDGDDAAFEVALEAFDSDPDRVLPLLQRFAPPEEMGRVIELGVSAGVPEVLPLIAASFLDQPARHGRSIDIDESKAFEDHAGQVERARDIIASRLDAAVHRLDPGTYDERTDAATELAGRIHQAIRRVQADVNVRTLNRRERREHAERAVEVLREAWRHLAARTGHPSVSAWTTGVRMDAQRNHLLYLEAPHKQFAYVDEVLERNPEDADLYLVLLRQAQHPRHSWGTPRETDVDAWMEAFEKAIGLGLDEAAPLYDKWLTMMGQLTVRPLQSQRLQQARALAATAMEAAKGRSRAALAVREQQAEATLNNALGTLRQMRSDGVVVALLDDMDALDELPPYPVASFIGNLLGSTAELDLPGNVVDDLTVRMAERYLAATPMHLGAPGELARRLFDGRPPIAEGRAILPAEVGAWAVIATKAPALAAQLPTVAPALMDLVGQFAPPVEDPAGSWSPNGGPPVDEVRSTSNQVLEAAALSERASVADLHSLARDCMQRGMAAAGASIARLAAKRPDALESPHWAELHRWIAGHAAGEGDFTTASAHYGQLVTAALRQPDPNPLTHEDLRRWVRATDDQPLAPLAPLAHGRSAARPQGARRAAAPGSSRSSARDSSGTPTVEGAGQPQDQSSVPSSTRPSTRRQPPRRPDAGRHW